MKYFVTGTMVYGPQTENSDLDIVLDMEAFSQVYNALDLMGVKTQEFHPDSIEGEGVGFHLGPIRVHLRPKRAPEFEAWRIATDRMKQLSPIKDRAERLDTFHSFIWEALA